MNATELKTIEKLNQPTILPGAVKINVKIDVNEEEVKLPEAPKAEKKAEKVEKKAEKKTVKKTTKKEEKKERTTDPL